MVPLEKHQEWFPFKNQSLVMEKVNISVRQGIPSPGRARESEVSFPDTEVGIPGGASGARGIIVLPTKICLHCGVKFRRSKSLQAHMEACKIDKKQRCIHCLRHFKNKSGLGTHLKYCKNKPIADQSTNTDGHAEDIINLGTIGDDDISNSSGDPQPELNRQSEVCEYCSKSFKNKLGLSTHLRYCKDKKRIDQIARNEDCLSSEISSEISFSNLANNVMNNGSVGDEETYFGSVSSIELQRQVGMKVKPPIEDDGEDHIFPSLSSQDFLNQIGQGKKQIDRFFTSLPSGEALGQEGTLSVPCTITSCEMMEELGRRVDLPVSLPSSPLIPSPPSLSIDAGDEENFPSDMVIEELSRSERPLVQPTLSPSLSDDESNVFESVSSGEILRQVGRKKNPPKPEPCSGSQVSQDWESSFPTISSGEISGQVGQENQVPPDTALPGSLSPISLGECEESEDHVNAEQICKESFKLREFKVVIEDDVCFPVKNKEGHVIQGFQCKVCRKVYTSTRQLLVHHRQHPECSGYVLECEGCHCRFRNEQGLKQHVQRSDCGRTDLNLQTKPTGGASHADAPRPLTRSESTHVHDTHKSRSQVPVDEEKQVLSRLPSRPNIQWPRMKDHKQWQRFENAVEKQLNKTASLENRLHNLILLIQEEGKELFGISDSSEIGNKSPLDRRSRQLINIRRKISRLTKAAAKADTDEERGGILLVRCELIEKRRRLRTAENSRKARWRRKKSRQSFYNDPYKASREVLQGTSKARLRVEKKVLDDYVAEVASDPLRDIDLEHLDGLPECSNPTIPFDESKFKYNVFSKILKRTRNASKPGPNGVPYKVYKKCPKLAQYLFSLLIGVLKSKKIPLAWRVSDGVFIPKVNKAKDTNINDFRQIALMNVEGKLFWALVADRLYRYIVDDNKYIKTSSQKGSIRNVPGCWEHTSMVWNALRDAKSSKNALAVLWLDLANAYGSVPHKLIEFALKRYQVPQIWIDIILDYYNGLWGRSGSGNIKSDWTRYEKGIFAGCTLSVILFLLAFNVIIEYVECGPIDKYILNGKAIEVVRGFMDDISLLVPSVPMAKVALTRTDEVLKWARMALKPSKSRSVVMKRGKLQKVQPFFVDGVVIPGLQEKPLRTLGRFFDLSIDDKDSRTTLFDNFCNGLWKLDKSSFTGFMKAWALHHVLIRQVEWDFMIYEMSLQWVEALQRKMNIFTRKWLGVARNLSNVALYSNQVPCPLPFKSLITLFKKTKMRSYLQLCDSKDEQVSFTAKPHYTGSKWKVAQAVNEAESRVRVNRIVGEVRGVKRGNSNDHSARAGLGFGSFAGKIPPEGSKEARKELVDTLDQSYEEQLLAEATNLGLQGAWLTWKGFIQRDLSWRSVLFGKSELTRFCLGATYGTLATPSNLKLWGIVEESSCYLCGEADCNIRHILSSCRVAQAQGRYLWRHNNVLRVIADGIQSFIQTNKVVSSGVKQIHFVRESGKSKEKKGRKPHFGILHRFSDFVLDVDLERQLKYPSHITESGLRPDIVIYSNQGRLVVHLELTCPIEENFQFAQARKEKTYGKFSELGMACTKNGWQVICLPVEVGARGYAGQTLMNSLRKLGLGRQRTKTLVKRAADECLRCSFWVWVLRERQMWKKSTGFKGDLINNQGSHDPLVYVKPKRKAKVPLIPKTLPTSWVPKDLKKSKKGSLSHQVKIPVPSKVPPFSDIPFRGLINPGNTCYANCIIQAISPLIDSRCYVVFGIAKEFLSLCSVLSQKDKAIAPTKFLKEFREKNPMFIEGKQHDASAFLTRLLLHIPYSILEDDLTVESRSAWTCKNCGKKKSYSEPTSVLQLSYAAGTLSGMVENYCKASLVKTFPCPSCSVKGHVMKHEEIANSPKYLILAVKKPLYQISIKNPLSSLQFKQLQYQLLSVIIHSGQDNAGHYVTIRKHEQQWLLFDDDKVAEIQISKAETLAQSGYMFVFCS